MNKNIRKQISFGLVLLLLVIALLLTVKIVSKVRAENQELQKEFVFDVQLYSSDTLNLREYGDKPFIVYFADPECEACKHEFSQLGKKIRHVLKQYNLLFITETKNEDMPGLLQAINVYPEDGVFVGYDNCSEIYNYYKIAQVPTILILDENFIPRKKVNTLSSLLNKYTE
ncbi:MAG: thioredoxin family protein [Dysgonamonadaceae bacterium]|jgi:thiol-disulfide isomerase/thioredoxin|nr:thioredoxin family protein [Dysgonamonadaceae bacterium]